MEKKVILILGQRGSGKSTIAKQLVRNKERLFIYDTLGEYQSEGVIFYDKVELLEFWKRHYKDRFKIIYQPLNPTEDFDDICDLVFECGNLCFLVEEIDSFLSSNTSGLSNSFLNIIQRGRHKEIELIGISQRPYAIPPIVRSQCKELYSFCQKEPRDLEYLRGFIGNEAEQVKDLKNYEFIIWKNGKIDKSKTKKV